MQDCSSTSCRAQGRQEWRGGISLLGVDDLRRPKSLDTNELGFTRRRPVPWLAPLLLLNTGLRALLAVLFGAYLDKRELQNALPDQTYQQRGVPVPTPPYAPGELWLDYVADTGDGFDASYSVAYLLGRPSLYVDGRDLPRGQALLMGGDQVYPTASMPGYEDRCKGPYEAALPAPPVDGPQPTLYAVPGNHDWYDGLTAFLRLFVRVETDHIGGWRTEQSRSYFAIGLPQGWWLYAIDTQFGAYIDDPQLIYFKQAAQQLGPSDRIILAVPEPTWVKANRDSTAYETIDYFIRTIVAPTGAEVRLILAGDLHHYARYADAESADGAGGANGAGRQLITCGGGGAYLAATHTLPRTITVPPTGTRVRKASPTREYELAGRYPSAARSRRLARGVFGRLPRRNPGFCALLGVVQTLLMLVVAGSMGRLDETERRLVSAPLALMVVVVLAGTMLFGLSPTGGPRRARQWTAGLVHGAAQLGLGLAGAWLWLRLPFVEWPWPLPLVAAAVLYLPVAGLVAGELVAAYLLVASWFRINVNELFAGQGIEDAKVFLRMHIARDGSLTIYPIAIDRICRRWRAEPDAVRPDAPWIVPARPDVPRTRLAEAPVTLPR